MTSQQHAPLASELDSRQHTGVAKPMSDAAFSWGQPRYVATSDAHDAKHITGGERQPEGENTEQSHSPCQLASTPHAGVTLPAKHHPATYTFVITGQHTHT